MPNLTAASQNLYELIKSQSLSVYPDDEIRLAVQRAVALETTRGWRIAKEKASHKIDVVVALAMAAYAAVQKGESGFMRVGTYNPQRWRRKNPLARPVAAAAARGPRLREGSD